MRKYNFKYKFKHDYLISIKMVDGKMSYIEESSEKKIYEVDNKKVVITTEESNSIKNIDEQINYIINGEIITNKIKYKAIGTPFQERVWREIEKIPYGETKTYKEIAIAIGNYKASRAVGLACNKNPLPIIIPCHRVIASSGKLNGYVYGVELKGYILEKEQEKINRKNILK